LPRLAKGLPEMTKRQLIDEILTINPTAQPGFLAGFKDADLGEYLTHLNVVKAPVLTGDGSKYRKYFANSAQIATTGATSQRAGSVESKIRTDDGANPQPIATVAENVTADAPAATVAAPVVNVAGAACEQAASVGDAASPEPEAIAASAAATNISETDLDLASTASTVTDYAPVPTASISTDSPSSDDVADVVWEDNQAFASDEATLPEDSSSLQASAAGHDDSDGDSQTQLAAVAGKLDVEKDEAPFAGSNAEAESYLF
jgi:hypothetical protein